MTDRDPDQLIEAARLGDRAAWKEIIAELGPLLRGYLRAIGDPDPDQELHDIFDTLASDIDVYGGGTVEEFVTCVFDIAVARQRNSRHDLPRASAYPQPGAHLDPIVRDAVLLAQIGNLEPRQIGYILNATPDQVRAWQDQGSAEMTDTQWGNPTSDGPG